MAKRTGEYVLVAPDGQRLAISNLSAFCRERGWDHEAARKVLDKDETYQGFLIYRKGSEPPAVGGMAAVQPPTGTDVPAPPELPDPAWPADKIRTALQRYVSWIMRVNAYYTQNPSRRPDVWKLKDELSVVQTMAACCGIDWKEVGDQRTTAQRVEEACQGLLIDGEEALCQAEEVVDAIETEMERATQGAMKYHDKMSEMARRQGREIADDPKSTAERARRWRDLFRRIRVLRDRARTAYDKTWMGVPEFIQRATHVLRFQAYVGRTAQAVPARIRDNAGRNVYVMGAPSIAIAMSIFYAQNGYGMVPGVGMLAPGEINPVSRLPFEAIPYAGVVIMVPPRHGKTDTLKHDTVLAMNLDPTIQQGYIHAVDEQAEEFNKSVAAYFTLSTAPGRRNLSLFPAKLAKHDNNASSIRLEVPNPPATPQHVAAGIGASALGKSFRVLRGDDLVPASDRFNPTDREKRKSIWDTTWMTRLTGEGAFAIISGYVHHREDLVWTYALGARRYAETGGREGIPFYVLRMPIPGPDRPNSFRPIFPELYSEAELRKKHRTMQDVTIWESNYGLSPQTKDQQIVQEVRLYDPSSEEHAEFMRSAQILVSIDPASKGHGDGDKVGMVIGALGEAKSMTRGMDADFINSENQLRIIHESEFHGTQSEVTQRLVEMGQMFRVDRVFVEGVGGYGSAIVEMLSTYHGAHAVEAEGVKNKDKRHRLKAVSGMIENGVQGVPAKVLFPGYMKKNDFGPDVLTLSDSMRRLVGYIVDFHMCTGWHSLDAFTLLCKKVMPDIGVGEGQFSKEVREVFEPVNTMQKFFDHKRRQAMRERTRSPLLAKLAEQGV